MCLERAFTVTEHFTPYLYYKRWFLESVWFYFFYHAVVVIILLDTFLTIGFYRLEIEPLLNHLCNIWARYHLDLHQGQM